nr:REDY-like protein HapK [Polymorphobacter sp.]
MRIIALFNLKPGVAREDYEGWAKSRDLPGVRSLVSVNDFNVYRTTGLLFTEGPAPFQYVEVLDIDTMDGFLKDCAGDLVQRLAPEMGQFAENVVFMTTEQLSVA